MTELHWSSAGELAAAIRTGDVSSTEVLDHLVARVDALDGPVNAVVCRERRSTAGCEITVTERRQRLA